MHAMQSLSDQQSPVSPAPDFAPPALGESRATPAESRVVPDRGRSAVQPRPLEDWRQELQQAIRDPFEICDILGLPDSLAKSAANHAFPLLAPRPFVARMRPGDPNDPLLLQVLPSQYENLSPSLPSDAVGDLAAQKADGLLHKYFGRALLILAPNCAVNCRYCFRRHFPYDTVPAGDAAWAPALDQIRADTTLAEILLSGGDPLVLGDRRLSRLIDSLEAIPHVTRLRIHTRLPVVIPQRVTTALCDTIEASRFRTVIVLHINHANEIDDAVATAVAKLRRTGAMLFNQSVLLRGVNDSVETQAALCERLVEVGVTPYYLHQLDMVEGVGHFETPVPRGLQIVKELRKRLPGYAVPRYVRENAGEPHKTPLE
jgi:EF-P beta-lysylation protein EpmB